MVLPRNHPESCVLTTALPGSQDKALLSPRTLSKDASAHSPFTLMPIYAKLLKQDTLYVPWKDEMPVSASQCFQNVSNLKLELTEVATMFPGDDP